MIIGRYDVRLDLSHRLVFPAVCHDAMGKPAQVYLVPDAHEKCVDLISVDVFEVWLKELRRNTAQRKEADELEGKAGHGCRDQRGIGENSVRHKRQRADVRRFEV